MTRTYLLAVDDNQGTYSVLPGTRRMQLYELADCPLSDGLAIAEELTGWGDYQYALRIEQRDGETPNAALFFSTTHPATWPDKYQWLVAKETPR